MGFIGKCQNRHKESDAYTYHKRMNFAYERGYTRCSECNCYFKKALLDNVFACPCCGGRLKVKPKQKAKLEGILGRSIRFEGY